MINIFNEERRCIYKDEVYCVRDNGAILRLPRDNERARPLDNKWTFGTKDEERGYMFFASKIRVHQVVATAFHGIPPSEDMIVDHKDTNRCNNRPDNLRWVTKLENVLNNPITRRKIIDLCGSIEAFLDNPSILRELSSEPNTKWMRTVTKEEANYCKKNLERWAEEDNHQHNGGKIDEWIFKKSNKNDDFYPPNPFFTTSSIDSDMEPELYIPEITYTESITPSAIQNNWITPTEFPLCPLEVGKDGLLSYYNNLHIGNIFCRNHIYESTILDFLISEDKSKIWIALQNNESIKPWVLVYITIEQNKFLHTTYSTYFDKNGLMKYYTIETGGEWMGEDSIDDFCM